ncbi:MAG: hypothetical protein L0323_18640 [Planctomycetes bacterium]|nr:hypothetical protein [Planctomycetota bacterium]
MRGRVPREKTLEDIRLRAASGLAVDRQSVRNTGLFERARRDFGTWGRALLAAGIQPLHPVPPRAMKTRASARRRHLTEHLLRSPLATRAICRLTGLAPKTVRERRRRLGIPAPPAPARSRLPAVGSTAPRYRTWSSSLASRMRERVGRLGPEVLRRTIPRLDPREAEILRRRSLNPPGDTLDVIAGDWGVTRQRVAQVEIEALRRLYAEAVRPGRSPRPREPG